MTKTHLLRLCSERRNAGIKPDPPNRLHFTLAHQEPAPLPSQYGNHVESGTDPAKPGKSL